MPVRIHRLPRPPRWPPRPRDRAPHHRARRDDRRLHGPAPAGQARDPPATASLDPTSKEQVAQHWTAAIGQEARRGKVALLLRYDRAYVSRFEEERGPITVDRYVAVERGTVDAVMRLLLALPKSILMRIERVWERPNARRQGPLTRHAQQAPLRRPPGRFTAHLRRVRALGAAHSHETRLLMVASRSMRSGMILGGK
ncbi:MAG: hypothetical protein R3F14_41135 [Polyangiaceae bacterium]